mmetsp:Transcript_229/g.354  ORF Transcript_229/g.354 Transcript_229/m.354 type:complete len:1118 (-) Transcript_229:29-3382(-)
MTQRPYYGRSSSIPITQSSASSSSSSSPSSSSPIYSERSNTTAQREEECNRYYDYHATTATMDPYHHPDNRVNVGRGSSRQTTVRRRNSLNSRTQPPTSQDSKARAAFTSPTAGAGVLNGNGSTRKKIKLPHGKHHLTTTSLPIWVICLLVISILLSFSVCTMIVMKSYVHYSPYDTSSSGAGNMMYSATSIPKTTPHQEDEHSQHTILRGSAPSAVEEARKRGHMHRRENDDITTASNAKTSLPLSSYHHDDNNNIPNNQHPQLITTAQNDDSSTTTDANFLLASKYIPNNDAYALLPPLSSFMPKQSFLEDNDETPFTHMSLSLWVKLLPSSFYSTNDGNKEKGKRIIFTTFTHEQDTSVCHSFSPKKNSHLANKNNNIIPGGGGISLYAKPINGKQNKRSNSNRKKEKEEKYELILEYLDLYSKQTKCYSLTSSVAIPSDEWMHIGVSFYYSQNEKNAKNRDGDISLFLDGRIIGQTTITVTNDDHKQNVHKEYNEPFMILGRNKPLFYDDDQKEDHYFSMEGHIAMLALWFPSSSSQHLHSSSPLAMMRQEYQTRQEAIMHQVYRIGFDTHSLSSFGSGSPTFAYPFDGEERVGVKDHVFSTLHEILKNQHGTIRRNIPQQIIEPYVHRGGNRYKEYTDGRHKPFVSTQLKQQSDNMARKRRTFVRNAMKHVWDGYKTYAWGKDELLPLSAKGRDNWGGMGTTLVDSLSTLWLMGMKVEFWEARDWVRDHLSHDHVGAVSVFETTIRSLGGLLSAYDFTQDKAFLEKADDLGSRLSKAFHSPSGIPYSETTLNGDKSYNTVWHSKDAILSELGTLQLEFRYLAKVTGNNDYATLVNRIYDIMEPLQPPDTGLFPLFIGNKGSKPDFGNARISLGAMGDSFYEYLLKVWLQGGKKEDNYRRMYDKAMDGVHKYLVQEQPGVLTYIAEMNNGRINRKMDHLSCFMGGTLALGAYTNPDGLNSDRAQRDLRLGKALAYTCYQMYAQSNTGIAPEYVRFSDKNDLQLSKHAPYYILRPEAAETFFILHTLTGDPTYREWGWEIFQAIEHHCKTDIGYASLVDVNNPEAGQNDKMESFFLAETLKYLFLLQDPDTELDLEERVFNTEAHPLRLLHLIQ